MTEKVKTVQEATQVLEACRATEERIRNEIRTTERGLAGIEALEQITQADLVARENFERRQKKLENQLAEAEEATAAAERGLAEASAVEAHEVAARLSKKVAEHEQLLAGYIRGEVAPRLQAELAAHQELVASASRAFQDAKIAAGTPRDAARNFRVRTRWCAISPTDPWGGIGEVMRGMADAQRYNSPEEVARRAELAREEKQLAARRAKLEAKQEEFDRERRSSGAEGLSLVPSDAETRLHEEYSALVAAERRLADKREKIAKPPVS